ncbi:hypothetical protein [Clostridium sp. 'White wine YQ']|uniref:hypothetical protein n=1 Tax=Clostridium sp. 'White wine YQ' TaxID=3027474 RepID=UPI002365664B|nr:hypothetical protein [Clostridium sp. 'White wine YQ']MDD7793675.1 hypothetical protein [Clostridium sp. 'White wine YQ']
MINKNEPLPKYMNNDYYECYAKVVLEELYPEEFVNLEIKDKPDLQTSDGKCGIEVTNAREQDQINAENVYSDICYNRVRDKKGSLAKIKKCGGNLEGGVLAGKPGKDSFDLILEAFKIKLNKLNGNGYKYFKWNWLFIFSDIYANDRMIMKATQEMQNIQLVMEKQFYKVVILVPGYCYCLKLYNGIYEINTIESNVQSIHATKARELVVKKYEKKE